MADSREPLLQKSKGRSESQKDSSPKPGYEAIYFQQPRLGSSPPSYETVTGGLAASNIQSPDDDVSESPRPEEIKVYRRRWYILIVYCVVSATQGGVWNTYGPISSTVENAFGWDDSTIALLNNWGPIAYLVAGIPMSWMLDVKGIRIASIVTVLFVAVGAALRCITFETPAVTWLTHAGQFLNGLGGPVAMAAPPILSAVWFPPHERTTATAIGTVLSYMGVALAYIMGPLLVPDVPSNNSTNVSSVHLSDYYFLPDANYSVSDITSFHLANNKTGDDEISKEKKGIALYLYMGAGCAAALLLLLLVYFPNRPPLPPCPSAAIRRESFLQGLKHLLTRGQFWLLAMIYGISLGTLNCWSSVLNIILKPHGISEDDAGWIGFYSICSACLASLVVARFADFFSRIMKWLVIVMYIIGTASFTVFALSTIKIIPPSRALFYTTIITGSTVLNAAVPLIFELACELSYPTGEGTTNGIMTILNNVFGLIFLFIMMVPNIGNGWTVWAMMGTSAGCVPLLFLMKVKYRRLEIDEHNPSLRDEIVFPAPQQ